MNNITEITKYSSLNKLIAITGYVLQFIKNSKLFVKLNGLRNRHTLQVNEYNKPLKLWIKYEQRLSKRQYNYSKFNALLKLFADEEGYV